MLSHQEEICINLVSNASAAWFFPPNLWYCLIRENFLPPRGPSRLFKLSGLWKENVVWIKPEIFAKMHFGNLFQLLPLKVHRKKYKAMNIFTFSVLKKIAQHRNCVAWLKFSFWRVYLGGGRRSGKTGNGKGRGNQEKSRVPWRWLLQPWT